MSKIIDSADVPSNQIPPLTVYIDAGSPWEMPQPKAECVTRLQLLEEYKFDLAHDLDKLRRIDELKDCDLMCSGADYTNHGEILLELAAMDYSQRLSWAHNYLAERKAA